MMVVFISLASLILAFCLGRWSAPKVPKVPRVRHITTSESWEPTSDELELLSDLFGDHE